MVALGTMVVNICVSWPYFFLLCSNTWGSTLSQKVETARRFFLHLEESSASLQSQKFVLHSSSVGNISKGMMLPLEELKGKVANKKEEGYSLGEMWEFTLFSYKILGRQFSSPPLYPEELVQF